MSLNSTTFTTRTPITADFLNAIDRGNQEQIALQRFAIPISAFRYSDGVIPVATAAAGKPGIKMGGWGVGTGYFQGENAKNATKTEYLVFDFTLPESYDDGEDVKVGVTCRYNQDGGTIDVHSVDCEVYEVTDAGAVGSDLCTTAAQAFSGTMTEYLFVVTDAGLVRGDRLRVLIKTVLSETADAGTQYAEVGGASVYADVKG